MTFLKEAQSEQDVACLLTQLATRPSGRVTDITTKRRQPKEGGAIQHHQIEAWALDVVGRVNLGDSVEDSRVELKAAWPDPQKAAGRIAGHANAVRGAEILWLIGVDEARGVVGADTNEMATWFPRVEGKFDSLMPRTRI